MFILNTHNDFLPFSDIREYTNNSTFRPAYFLLKDSETKHNVLCRKLSPSESASSFKNICYLHEVGGKKASVPCLIICQVKSESYANAIVASYKNAFTMLENKNHSYGEKSGTEHID